MFSFHRPKVYRSSTGCCICKAKSSSSRFTDSKKYEEDFLECFKLSTPRQGEICNACVLLVKRWKKLPVGTERNWQHVVDARAGPGMKSFTKFKSRNKKPDEKSVSRVEKIKRKRHYEREMTPESDGDMEEVDFFEGPSVGSSPGVSDSEETLMPVVMVSERRRHRKGPARKWCEPQERVSGFVDLEYWKKEQLCCGTIFRGRNNEIMIDPCLLKPCIARLSKKGSAPSCSKSDADAPCVKTFSDNSSDSGYDESSNPGAPEHARNFPKTTEPPHLQYNKAGKAH